MTYFDEEEEKKSVPEENTETPSDVSEPVPTPSDADVPEMPPTQKSEEEEPPRPVTPSEPPYTTGYRGYYGQNYGAPYGEPPRPKKKKNHVNLTYGAVALLVAVCLLFSVAAGAGINLLLNDTAPVAESTTASLPIAETTGAETPLETTGTVSAAETTASAATAPLAETVDANVPTSLYASIAERCMPSVVIVTVSDGAGSGVIYRKDGYIITNYHVVGEDETEISVTLYDGTEYDAAYIYGDEYSDISVIKIEKDDCTPVQIGDSAKMRCGDIVVAIGNPLGSGLAITEGIVSAVARDITIDNLTMTLMQTTAAINHGNSGGGLFNASGELIGIVNAKSEGSSIDSIGYAIPSATVVKCVNDLSAYGYVTGKARLGVTVQTKQYQTWPYLQTYALIQVTEINPSGSCASSELQAGDILQKINGTEFASFAELQILLTKYAVGDTVKLTVRRPTIEYTGKNLSEYLNTCREVEIEITFVEFNPNAQ